jgi:hypothetical protein
MSLEIDSNRGRAVIRENLGRSKYQTTIAADDHSMRKSSAYTGLRAFLNPGCIGKATLASGV